MGLLLILTSRSYLSYDTDFSLFLYSWVFGPHGWGLFIFIFTPFLSSYGLFTPLVIWLMYCASDCCCHDGVSANVKPAFLVPTQMDGASRDPCQPQKAGNKDKRQPCMGGDTIVQHMFNFIELDSKVGFSGSLTNS